MTYQLSYLNPDELKTKKIFYLNISTESDKLIGDGFRTYNQYLDYYNSGSKRGKARLKNKIYKLKESLIENYGYYIDPIEYIIQLYYGEGFSIVDVSIRLNELGWNNSENTSLEKTFKQVFGWKLRNNSGSEVTSNKKRDNNQTSKALETCRINYENKYKRLEIYFKSNIERIITIGLNEFDKNGFNKLNKTGKILYILYFLYGINRKVIKELNKEGIGAIIILKHIKNDLQGFLNELGIELNIYPKDIQAIFE